METRRLRLSVVAYLRGHLEPYYEHGKRSLVRENMIIRAISRELSAEALSESTLIDASIVSVHKNASGLYSTMYDKVNEVKAMREQDKVITKPSEDFFTDPRTNKRRSKEGLTGDQQQLVDMYKVLHEAGIMDKIVEQSSK